MAVVGQRPSSKPRSYRIMEALRHCLNGVEVDRNLDVYEMYPDVYLQWGFRLTPALESVVMQRKPFVICDGGFFHDRDEHFSVYFNGFQRLGFLGINVPSRARTARPAVQPWVDNPDGKIVVYGQVPTDRSLRDINHDVWVDAALDDAAATGKRVQYREHPKMASKRGVRLPPMENDFHDMSLAVTYTSTAGVQTTLAGIPTVVGHPAAICAPVASPSIMCPFRMPGREYWADQLTWFQYHDSEPEEAAEFIWDHLSEAAVVARSNLYDLEGIRP